jgi:hypothetical protein
MGPLSLRSPMWGMARRKGGGRGLGQLAPSLPGWLAGIPRSGGGKVGGGGGGFDRQAASL